MASYVSSVTVPRDSNPRLPPVWTPNGAMSDHVHRVEPVMSDDGRPDALCIPEPCLHLLEPVTVIDRGEDAPVRSQEGLVLELEILGQRHQDALGDGPGDRLVPGVNVDGDRRERRRIDLVWDAGPARRSCRGRRAREPVCRRRRCRPRRRRRRRRRARVRAAPRTIPAPDCPRPRAGSRIGRARPPPIAVRGRAGRGSGEPAQTTTRPARSPTLVPNSLVCGAIRSVLATATRMPNTTRPTRPAGTVFGSVIMKNRKISTSGEMTITRQKSTRRPARTPSSRSCSGPRRRGSRRRPSGRPRRWPPGRGDATAG